MSGISEHLLNISCSLLKDENMNVIFLSIAASNGELSTDGSGVKTESKNGTGDSDAIDGYPGHSIPIEGDGVKIETGAECDEPVDDNTGVRRRMWSIFLSFYHPKFGTR